MELGLIPPHNIEIECAVIGAMMLDSSVIPTVIHNLTPEHFYRPENSEVFNCIVKLFNANEPVDLLTIVNKARQLGKLEYIGGPYYIAQVSNAVASATNTEFHVAILNQLYVKRQASRIGNELHKKSYEADADGFEIIGDTANEIFKLTNSALRKTIVNFGDELKRVISDLDQPFQSGGIHCGFKEIDAMLGGFHKSDLSIIAARPGMGKTSFMASMVRFIAGRGNPVGVFSLEMSTNQIISRMLGTEAKIPTSNFRTMNFSEREWDRINNLPESFYELPILLDDSPGISLVELNAKARQMRHKGAKIIFVDYLQLVKTGNKNREQEVAEVSRGLKNLAKSLGIPVVALAQLNREVENRADKRPQLSDLRESGEIENSADSVAFLVRPEYYKLDTFTYKGRTMSSDGVAIFDVQKNRHGATGDMIVHFQKELTSFIQDTQ
jgi:replicative DNA helicase